MTKAIKRRQEYKDFRFRRRHDHFLRFKLQRAKPEEVIDTAKELGFNLNLEDLTRKGDKKKPMSRRRSTLIGRLRDFWLPQNFPREDSTSR